MPITTAVEAASFVSTSSSLTVTKFTQQVQDYAIFNSAVALISSPKETFFGASDPQFVTGGFLIPHPETIKLPVFVQTIPDGTTTSLPLNLDFINGQVRGTSQIRLAENQQVLSANLTSKLQYQITKNISFISSTVGQSGWDISFFIPAKERFAFDFTSLINLQTTTANLQQKEAIVIYFYSLPSEAKLDNPLLFFSSNPHPTISASDPLIDVGLLEINKQQDSLRLFGNSNPYFQINQISNQQVSGSFQYFADEPTTLTIVAYTSSSLTSFNSNFAQNQEVVPEPSPNLSLGFFYLIIVKRQKIRNLVRKVF